MGIMKGKCPHCGEEFEFETDEEAGICDKCGLPYITEAVINNKANDEEKKIDIIIDEASFENLQKKAVVYLKLEEYEKAKQTCQKIIYYYPEMVFGWYGLARAISLGFTSTKHYDNCLKNLNKAISLASAKELKYIKENSNGFATEAKLAKHKKSTRIKTYVLYGVAGFIGLLGIILLIAGLANNSHIPAGTNFFPSANGGYYRTTGNILIITALIMLIVLGVGIGLFFPLKKLKKKQQDFFDRPLEKTDFEDDDYIKEYLTSIAVKRAKAQAKAEMIAEEEAKKQNNFIKETNGELPKKLPSDILDDLPFEAPKPKKKYDDFHI